MRMCHLRPQNDPFDLNKIFLAQTIITFIYLLVLFIVQNFKKILTTDTELWGCAIFEPRMVNLKKTNTDRRTDRQTEGQTEGRNAGWTYKPYFIRTFRPRLGVQLRNAFNNNKSTGMKLSKAQICKITLIILGKK